MTVTAPATYAVTAFGSNTTESVTVKGTVISTNVASAISGNGDDKYTQTDINIEDGAVVKSEADTAIYYPQIGTLTIGSATIEGPTAIKMKSGELTITGNPTIAATVTEETYEANSSGPSTSDGYAVAVVKNNHYAGNTVANLSAGTYTGIVKILDDNDPAGGDGTISITGGTYNTDVSEYLATDYKVYEVTDADGNKIYNAGVGSDSTNYVAQITKLNAEGNTETTGYDSLTKAVTAITQTEQM